jgi:predicted  nucleic acid-binding Zn-ribbon protein
MPVQVPVSVGELLDKLTILAIKLERIDEPAKRANIAREHAALEAVVQAEGLRAPEGVTALEQELRAVNEQLWRIEDEIREHERQQRFDDAFIALARAVYRTNDERAALKRRLNALTGSELVEEKSYAAY